MAVVLAAAAPPWPRRWSDQQHLPEHQHDRLASQQQEPRLRHEADQP